MSQHGDLIVSSRLADDFRRPLDQQLHSNDRNDPGRQTRPDVSHRAIQPIPIGQRRRPTTHLGNGLHQSLRACRPVMCREGTGHVQVNELATHS
jgi:hypothetical protein